MSFIIIRLREALARLQDPLTLSPAEKAELKAFFSDRENATICVDGENRQAALESEKSSLKLSPEALAAAEAELKNYRYVINLTTSNVPKFIEAIENWEARAKDALRWAESQREELQSSLRQITLGFNKLSDDAKSRIELPPEITISDFKPRYRDSWTCADGSLSGERLAYIDFIERKLAHLETKSSDG